MKFRIEIWSIAQLKAKYDDNALNLNPPYQRRFIWSIKDQQTLINSILRGYAIPNIFLKQNKTGSFEMVDGQQRTRTILGFMDKQFNTFDNQPYNPEIHDKIFSDYFIPITIIEKMSNDESIEEFYALVNKSGIHLNRPELKKAEYFDTNFLKLVTSLSNKSSFKKLDLFTDLSSKRMNDIDFVSELVTILLEGNSDKKIKVDKAFENDISDDTYKRLEKEFLQVLSIIELFNKRYALKKTRYKQRNDFYTIFGFINKNISINPETLLKFYELLLKFNDDISPSNEKCEPFQLYAFHCISQSNSKTARDFRLKIFEELFLNKKNTPNKIQISVMKYYNLEKKDFIKIDDYLTFDLTKI